MTTHDQTEPKGNPKHQNLTNPCNGTNRQGEPCKLPAMRGGKVCRSHGGAAPQTKRKARERLEAAADRMARELLGMATDTNVAESVRLAAIRDALSRAGVSERAALEVTHELKPWESMLETAAVEHGSRAEYRASVGRPDPVQTPAIEESTHTRPGGARVLASHPDGYPFIIEGEPVTSERNAGESDDHTEGDDGDQADESASEMLANRAPLALPAAGGYMAGEIAMEAAAEANRAHRGQLRRR